MAGVADLLQTCHNPTQPESFMYSGIHEEDISWTGTDAQAELHHFH